MVEHLCLIPEKSKNNNYNIELKTNPQLIIIKLKKLECYIIILIITFAKLWILIITLTGLYYIIIVSWLIITKIKL